MDDKKTISDLVAETKEPDATPIDFGCGEDGCEIQWESEQ